MSSTVTQQKIEALESALFSGELQVRIGDRWITYRSVDELKDALSYARNELAKKQANQSGRGTTYVADLNRGV